MGLRRFRRLNSGIYIYIPMLRQLSLFWFKVVLRQNGTFSVGIFWWKLKNCSSCPKFFFQTFLNGSRLKVFFPFFWCVVGIISYEMLDLNCGTVFFSGINLLTGTSLLNWTTPLNEISPLAFLETSLDCIIKKMWKCLMFINRGVPPGKVGFLHNYAHRIWINVLSCYGNSSDINPDICIYWVKSKCLILW